MTEPCFVFAVVAPGAHRPDDEAVLVIDDVPADRTAPTGVEAVQI